MSRYDQMKAELAFCTFMVESSLWSPDLTLIAISSVSLAGQLPGTDGEADPNSEPLGTGGVDRSMERQVRIQYFYVLLPCVC